ncbi:unnamed protein product [Echinostoma caproni]|uniref:Uncharacterized protein n=1 Tax=Echinostoma caproni TaxID=27848 RepID=A0A183AL97_9TREM|nr:unnamed protein product [Echinostoma caproni]
MIISGSPIASDFVFKDKELEGKLNVFLDNQTKFITIESLLETNREELAQKNQKIENLEAQLTELKKVSVPPGPNGDASTMDGTGRQDQVNRDNQKNSEELGKEVSVFRGQLQLAHDEIANLQAQLETLKVENLAVAASKISSLETELSSARQELDATRAALETSKISCTELTKQLNFVHSNVLPCVSTGCQTDEYVSNEQQVDNQTESLELISARNRIIQLTAGLDRVSSELKDSQDQVTKCHADRLSADKETQEQIAKLNDALSTTRTELDQVRAIGEARVTELEIESKRLQAVCDHHVNVLGQIQSERETLCEQLEQLKGRYEAVRKNYDDSELQRTRQQNDWAAERSTLTAQLVSYLSRF